MHSLKEEPSCQVACRLRCTWSKNGICSGDGNVIDGGGMNHIAKVKEACNLLLVLANADVVVVEITMDHRLAHTGQRRCDSRIIQADKMLGDCLASGACRSINWILLLLLKKK